MRDLDILKGNIDAENNLTPDEMWNALSPKLDAFKEQIKSEIGSTGGGSSEDCNAAWNAFYKEISGEDYTG